MGSLTEWKNKVANPLREGQSHDANNRQLSRARVSPPPIKILTKIENRPSTQSKSSPDIHVTKVCLLLLKVTNSRTKTLIADQLPTKTDKVVFCPLTDTQREAYENLMECEDIQLIKRRSEKCDCGSDLTRGKCCYSTTAEGARIESLIFPYHPPYP